MWRLFRRQNHHTHGIFTRLLLEIGADLFFCCPCLREVKSMHESLVAHSYATGSYLLVEFHASARFRRQTGAFAATPVTSQHECFTARCIAVLPVFDFVGRFLLAFRGNTSSLDALPAELRPSTPPRCPVPPVPPRRHARRLRFSACPQSTAQLALRGYEPISPSHLGHDARRGEKKLTVPFSVLAPFFSDCVARASPPDRSQEF